MQLDLCYKVHKASHTHIVSEMEGWSPHWEKWCWTALTTDELFMSPKVLNHSLSCGLMCPTVLHQNYTLLSHSFLLLGWEKFKKSKRNSFCLSCDTKKKHCLCNVNQVFGQVYAWLCILATKYIFLYPFKWLHLRSESFHFLFTIPPACLPFYLSPWYIYPCSF